MKTVIYIYIYACFIFKTSKSLLILDRAQGDLPDEYGRLRIQEESFNGPTQPHMVPHNVIKPTKTSYENVFRYNPAYLDRINLTEPNRNN